MYLVISLPTSQVNLLSDFQSHRKSKTNYKCMACKNSLALHITYLYLLTFGFHPHFGADEIIGVIWEKEQLLTEHVVVVAHGQVIANRKSLLIRTQCSITGQGAHDLVRMSVIRRNDETRSLGFPHGWSVVHLKMYMNLNVSASVKTRSFRCEGITDEVSSPGKPTEVFTGKKAVTFSL